MSEDDAGRPGSDPPQGGAGPDTWLHDWITLWQSEMAALAADREAQEAMQAMIGLWATSAHALADAVLPKPAHEPPAGHAGPAAPSGPAPAAAAPDPRDAEIERLRGRLGDLERRLGELERTPRHAPPRIRRPRR